MPIFGLAPDERRPTTIAPMAKTDGRPVQKPGTAMSRAAPPPISALLGASGAAGPYQKR